MRKILPILCMLMLALSARAQDLTLVSTTGLIFNSFILANSTAAMATWSQNSTYSNVNISAVLLGPTSGTAYLTTHVGVGTTVSNELAHVSVNVPNTSLVRLFSGLTLGPGTYYLVFAGVGAWAESDLTQLDFQLIEAPGISSLTYATANSQDPYPPATGFASGISNTFFQMFAAVGGAPYILLQPLGQTVPVGKNATFSTQVDGSTPLIYQWYFNHAILPGETNGTLTLTNVDYPNGGNYNVVVTNIYGSITSSIATLVVPVPPNISTQPIDQTVLPGTAVTFSVSAGGTGPLFYQWRFNGGNISGASNPSFTLGNAQPANSGGYDVVVANAGGSVTSSVANLTVFVTPPVITNQPSTHVTSAGQNYTLSVGLTGSQPLSYQWTFNGTNIASATRSSLVFTGVQPSNNGVYSVIISNIVGVTNSAPATLSVMVPDTYLFTTPTVGRNTLSVFDIYSAIPDKNGRVYVSTQSDVRSLVSNGTAWLPTSIDFGGTYFGLAVDPNSNVYVADWSFSVISRFSPNGTTWSKTNFVGQPNKPGTNDGTNISALFSSPAGIVLDAVTNLYVCDQHNHTIRKISPNGTNWVVTTLAGLGGSPGFADGTNSDARFNFPSGIAMDANSNLYVAEFNNSAVRQISPVGTNWVVTTIAGNGKLGSEDGTNTYAEFTNPNGIAVDAATNLYVVDSRNHLIRKITPQGTNWVTTTIGGLGGSAIHVDGVGSAARFNNPQFISLDISNNLYIGDYGNGYVRVGQQGTVPSVSSLSNLVLSMGDTANFAVTAAGTSPLSYQWKFKTTKINGATNVSLVLTNVQTKNSGLYTVTVANLFGSVSSSANLVVNPFILNVISQNLQTNGIQLQISGALDTASIVVYASTNLTDWVPIATNTSIAGAIQFSDPYSTNYPVRYYRAVEQ